MTELIRKKLSDSAGARWTALFIVAFTMMMGYFITDVMSPLEVLLETSKVASVGLQATMVSLQGATDSSTYFYSCSSLAGLSSTRWAYGLRGSWPADSWLSVWSSSISV